MIKKLNRKNIPAPTHFGKNLKFLRLLNGKNQTQLAEELGLNRNNIASYEAGVVEPNIEKFLSTCTYFDVEPKSMLEHDLSLNQEVVIKDADEIILSTKLMDHLEAFIKLTNEMTTVYEGYRTLHELRKESLIDAKDRPLYALYEDFLGLLDLLITTNWEMIKHMSPGRSQEKNSNNNYASFSLD